jgi:hypothetical protein
MKPSLKSSGICIAIIGATLTGNATILLDFDDLSTGPAGSYAVIQNGYGGLQWSGFGAINATLLSPPDGYLAGMISPDNVAFNDDEYDRRASISSGNVFNLDSAYLTAQVVEGMQVEVQGFAGNQLTYDNTYTLSATTPSLINFNYDGITQVEFIPLNPVTIFVMDNLTVTAVPEPNPSMLLSLGVVLSSLRVLKRKPRV